MPTLTRGGRRIFISTLTGGRDGHECAHYEEVVGLFYAHMIERERVGRIKMRTRTGRGGRIL